jgi:hypothetical protein
LDSIDCDADPSVSPASIQIRLVSFEFGGFASDEPVYPSGSLGLVGQTF